MRRFSLTIVASFILFAARVPAQVVFFDDFNGSTLHPHWSPPLPWWWEYNVSGGMLNVTRLLHPSSPDSGYNYAALYTYPFVPQG